MEPLKPTLKSFKDAVFCNDFTIALKQLTQIISGPLDSTCALSIAKILSLIPTAQFTACGYQQRRIAILGGFSTQLLTHLLRVTLLRYRIVAECFETPFGLFENAIYGADPELTAFKPELCYLCVGLDNLSWSKSHSIPDTALETEIGRWIHLWEATFELLQCPIVFNTFEEPIHRVLGNFEAKYPQSPTFRTRSLNLAIAQRAPHYVHLNDVNFLAAIHGRTRWRDETLYDLYKMPIAEPCWLAFTHSAASVIASVFGPGRKCLVVDLDNTLWGGVVGDDGVDHIEIGEDTAIGSAYLRLQRYLKGLKERGVLLAVCSKNDEPIAKSPFVKRTEMILNLDDFAAFVANWQDKASNTKAIAQQLNIGLDSIVFLDDNPVERELIRTTLPEVGVVELPANPADYTYALSCTYFFDAIQLTEEDRTRCDYYRSNSTRASQVTAFTDYQSFLSSLEMSATIGHFDLSHAPRITQLINKTNQFNLTTKRYTQTQIIELLDNPQAVTFYVKLKDKFGDNGLICVFIGFIKKDTLTIDTWLMSCRVLKRDVEKLLFQTLIRLCSARGLSYIHGVYRPTPKNNMVKTLYEDLGFTLESRSELGETQWIYPLKHPAQLDRVIVQQIPIRLTA